MTANRDNRKLRRAKYHEWMRRRWEERSKAAAKKRERREGELAQ
jgi:hypothetical protein